MKKTLSMILALLLIACSLPSIITSYADDSQNLLANATNANGAVTWDSGIDVRSGIIDSTAESVYGGPSWTFGLGLTDHNSEDYEHVYIKASGLTVGTDYDFSFIYQKDYKFAIESIKNANGASADFAAPATEPVADKERSYKVSTTFTAPASGDYTITLITGRCASMRASDCKWDVTILSDLSLTKIEAANYLANATNANGAVTWDSDIDVRGGSIDSTAESVYGSPSWTFGISNANTSTEDYERVYIKVSGLTVGTTYDFSFIYQKDYKFAIESIKNANGDSANFSAPATENVADKERSYKVSTSFTVPDDGDYTITLITGRCPSMRASDCKWDVVILSDLSLTKVEFVNHLANATNANGDVTWTTVTNVDNRVGNLDAWGGTHQDNKTNSVNGGYSWLFGLGDGKVGGDGTYTEAKYKETFGYVYIKARGLKADTRYQFSYIYQEDYIMFLDSITDKDSAAVQLETPATTVPCSAKARSYQVSAIFKAPKDGDYTITLKTNRANVTSDCKYSKVILSDLVLTKATTAQKVKAEAIVSGYGDVTVSEATPAMGSQVTYTAIPLQGEDFLGWYDGDTKVSDQMEYTFTINADTTLTAKFSSKNLNVLAGKKASDWKGYEWSRISDSTESRNGGKGYVVSSAMYQSVYTTVTLKPNTEYNLSFNWKSAASDKGHSYPNLIGVYSVNDADIEDRTNWIDGGNYSPKNATNLVGAVQYPTPEMAKSEEWQSLATTFTTSGDTEYNLVIRFGLTGSPADQIVNLSDFILEDANGEAQVPTISDKKAAEWTGYQWSQVTDSTESRNGGNGFLVKEAMYQNMYTHLTLNPNTEYKLSFEWKAVANSVGVVYPTEVVVVSRNDIDIDNRANWVESDFKYGAFDLEHGAEVGSAAAAATLKWQHATTSFKTKGDSEYSLLIHFQAPGNGHQQIYVSDFVLEEIGSAGGGDEDDAENLAATYSNAAGNVTWTDNSDLHYSDRRSDIEGGLSWKFGIANTDYETNPAYVYIKTHDLEANHKYEFSYIYSKDFRISLDSISDDVAIYYSNEIELLEGDRANRITVRFETKKAGAHTITLKMGKNYNNKDCAWDGVILSDLKLYDITDRIFGKVSTEAGGTITGFDKSYCTRGDEITLTATPRPGNTFDGWYNAEGTKVSSDAVYTFTAESDFDLTARYLGTNIPNIDWLEQHGMDGTFEDGTMIGWKAEDRDNHDDTSWASFERSTDMSYNGKYSLRFRSRYRTTFFRFTELNKNTNYMLSFYVNDPDLLDPQTDDEDEVYNNEALIRWFSITSGGATLYSESGSQAAPAIKGGSGWYKVNLFFNTGELTEVDWNFFYTDKNGAPIEFIYMDDISLVEYTSDAFKNGNFESGVSPWRGELAVDNGAGKGANFFQNVNLGEQSLYTVTFKAKGKGVGGASQITTKDFDATTYVSSQSAVNINSDDWKTYSFDVFTGVNPDVSLFFKATEGELLVDDVTVTKAVDRSGAIVEKVDFESERFALHVDSDVFEIYNGTEGDANVYSGTKSLRFNSANAEEGIKYILEDAFVSAQIPPMINYRLTLYYKTTTGNSIYLAPEFLPAEGVNTTYTAAGNGWTKVEFLFSKIAISYIRVIIGNILGETNADFYIDDITLTIAPPMVIETNSANKYCEWPLNFVNNQGFEDKITKNDWANLPGTTELRTDGGSAGDNYLRVKAGTHYVLPVKIQPGYTYYFSVSTRLGKNSSGYVAVATNPAGTKLYADVEGNPASKIAVDSAKWSRDSILFSTSESEMIYLVFAADKGYIDVDEVHVYQEKYGKDVDPNDHTKFVPYNYDNPDPTTVVLNGGDPTFSGNEVTEEESSPETGDNRTAPATILVISTLAAFALVATTKRTRKSFKGGKA